MKHAMLCGVLAAALALLAPARAEPPAVAEICRTLAEAAADNDLPEEFFTRLIWQESRFEAGAVSPAGAQGIAQFMPQTAAMRGLASNFSEGGVLAASERLRRKYAVVLGERLPLVLYGRRGSGSTFVVRVSEKTSTDAAALCAQLRAAGGACIVVRNPGG